MDEAFKKWGALGKDGKQIAHALFQASEGKVTRLNCRTWNDEDSIWEKALKIIFPGQRNTPRDRFFLWSFWMQERKGVVEEYQKFRGKPLPRSQKTNHSQEATQSQGQSRKEQGHCFCQRTYKLVHNVPMLQCDECSRWLHGICADRNAMDYRGNRSFVCDICSGKASIPPIFQQTPQSSPAVHDQDSVTKRPEKTTTPSIPTENKSKANRRSGLRLSAGMSLFSEVSPTKNASKEQTEEDLEDISSEGSLGSDTDTARQPTSTEDSRQKVFEQEETQEELSDEVTISAEEKNYDLLQKQIEEEAFRQNQALIEEPISKVYTSQLSLNVNPDEDDDLQLNDPISPKKGVKNQGKKDNSDTETDEEENIEIESVKQSESSKQKPLDDEEEAEEFIDTSNMPSCFTDKLTYSEWRKFVRTKEDDDKDSKEKGYKSSILRYKDGLRIDSEYTHVFSKIFDRYNWVCVLGFNKYNFKPNAQRAAFFMAYATCTKPPRTCPVKYSFTIRETPKIDVAQELDLEVRLLTTVGPMHALGYTGHRRLHGTVLENLKDELKGKKASTLRSILLANADPKAMETGKLNEVKTLPSLRQVRSTALKEEDLDKDIIKDILATREALLIDFPSKTLPNYIQSLSILPFKVVMYSKMQFDLLNRITKRFGPRTVQLDATGQLVKKLPAPYDQGDVSITTIIVRSPKAGEQVLPFAEMLSTDNTTTSIAYFLKQVFETYRKACNVTLPYYGIERLEIDFSKANLAAGVNVFTGLTVAQYLDKLWNIMDDESGEPPNLFPIHVCRFHVIRALEAHLKKGVGAIPDEESKTVIRKWFRRLTHAKTLWTFHRLCTDAAFFFGQLYLTKQLLERIKNIDSTTDKIGTKPWANFTFSNAQRLDIPFYKRNPFGAYAEDIFGQMAQHNKNLGSSGRNIQFNPMYDPPFLDTLEKHYMPYFPIISYAVIDYLGVSTTDTTTNAIEQYHGLIKTSIYPNEIYMKAPRFLRRQAKYIKGNCHNQLSVLASIPNKPKHVSTSQSNKASNQTKNKDTTGDNTNDSTRREDTETKNKLDQNPSSDHQEKESTPGATRFEPIFDESDDGLIEGSLKVDEPSKKTKKQKKTYPYDDDDAPSPESQRDVWKGKVKKGSQTETVVDTFDVPLIRWGGNVKVDDTTIVIGNSCAMDTSCQILVALYLKNDSFKAFLDKEALTQQIDKNILQTILSFIKGESDGAKSCWLTKALELTSEVIGIQRFHSEDEYGWSALKHWFPIKKNYWCSNEECLGFQDRGFWAPDNMTLLDLHPFSIDHFLTIVNGETFAGYKCTQCLSKMKTDVNFQFDNMPFIFYGINEDRQGKSREEFLRYTQKIKGVTYKVFAYTILINEGRPSAHYVTKFVVNYKKIIYNGLNRQPVSQVEKTNEIVTSVWLCKDI